MSNNLNSPVVAGGGWSKQVYWSKRKMAAFMGLALGWIIVDIIAITAWFIIEKSYDSNEPMLYWSFWGLIVLLALHPIFVITCIYFAIFEKKVKVTKITKKLDTDLNNLY